MIIYHRALDACELESVQNYLGTKYGRDYNNIAANYNLASVYTEDIAGIGAFAQLVLVLQLKDAGSSNILTVNNPTSNDNTGDFLTFGHSIDALTEFTNDLPSNLNTHLRIEREWKFDRDGDVGLVDIQFDLSGLSLSGDQSSDFVLLIDQDGDGDFTTGSVDQINPSTYSSEKVTFEQVSVPNNAVVTLVTFSRLPAPGGIGGAVLWLDASDPDADGVTSNNPFTRSRHYNLEG